MEDDSVFIMYVALVTVMAAMLVDIFKVEAVIV